MVAPLALVQEAVPLLRRRHGPAVLNITSDASVEAYEGWGGYGLVQGGARPPERGPGRRGAGGRACGPSTPATCAPRCTRTPSPGEDISDRPLPAEVVPDLVRLIEAATAERALPPVRPAAGTRSSRSGRERS